VALVPADSLDPDALTALFNGAYSDYFVPLELDRGGLELTIEICDIDLAASRVAVEDGAPVAFAFLGLRGDEGWIGGMGTLPAHRRRGLGEQALKEVLAEARSRGARSVRLEVIEQNGPARRLYEKLGFAHERVLNIWILGSAPPQITRAQPADPGATHAWIKANRRGQEPWQRADETLEHMQARGLAYEALTVDGDGAVLYRGNGVLQLAARDDKVAAHLLAAVGAQGDGLRFVNVPDGDPANAALALLKAQLQLRQHELRVTL
jgi:ribosomal protein S18 acetylase RimI-like enzyme